MNTPKEARAYDGLVEEPPRAHTLSQRGLVRLQLAATIYDGIARSGHQPDAAIVQALDVATRLLRRAEELEAVEVQEAHDELARQDPNVR